MIIKFAFSLMGSFFIRRKKQGFTLAEALIITVMTGACLLPILGTMQNAQVRTENYDHQSKMQMYARSRLNAEIANAAFDHKSVNLENEYHYIAYFAKEKEDGSPATEADASLIEFPKTTVTPEEIASLSNLSLHDEWSQASKDLLGINTESKHYFKLIHAYKTSVETKDSPRLAVFSLNLSGGMGRESLLDSPKALLGIVVKTCLLYSNEQYYYEKDGYLKIDPPITEGETVIDKDTSVQVVPVTLFSFVNLPVVSDEMIWLADGYNWKLYGIDPVGRTVSSIIDLPQSSSNDTKKDHFRPWHIAVHPSLKMLAYQTEKYVYLVNIDRKSPAYKDTILITSINHSKKSKYGGVVFRPDGKCLFVVADNKLIPIKIDYRIANNKVLDWILSGSNRTPNFIPLLTTDVTLDIIKISGLVAANDGYLYVAQKEGDKKGVYRFPMYPSNWTSWGRQEFIKTTDNIYSIDVSPDGNYLAVVTKYENLSLYDTKEGKVLYKDKSIKDNSNYKYPFKAIFTTYSDNIIELSEAKQFSVAVTNKDTAKDKYFTEYFYGSGTAILNRSLKNRINDKIRGWNIIATPDNKYVVINDLRKARVYFSKSDLDNSKDDYLADDDRIVSYRKIESFSDDDTEEAEGHQEDNDENDNVNEFSTEITTNKRDILAVASDKKIKLYDINTFNEIEDAEFETEKSIKSLSFNPNGTILAGGYANAKKEDNTGTPNTGHFLLHLNSMTRDISDNGGFRKKLIFDEKVSNMLFALEDAPGTEGDAIWNINNNSDYWKDVAGTVYDRMDFSLTTDWNRLDMIGMPNGGVMVLYGKNDGSSMLEWIGRRNWADDPSNGQYKLFARWTNIKSPSYSIPTKDLGIVSGNVIDGDLGTIIRLKEKFESTVLPSNVSIRTGNKAVDGSHEWSDGNRFITALLLEQQSDGGFNVVAQSNDLCLNHNITKEFDLTWTPSPYTFDPDKIYYLAFWNGRGVSGPNEGVAAYSFSDSGSTCISDLIKTSSWQNEQSNKFSSVPDSSTIYDPNIGGVSRNYAIKFRCQTYSDNFPPGNSKKLAISPDCKTLGILSGSSSSDSILSFYDFNNQLYGPETQLEGMLVDYRKKKDSGVYENPDKTPIRSWPNEDESLFEAVASFSHFNGLAATDKNGCISSLASATTKYDSWTSFNKTPANYWFNDAPAETSINGSKSVANKRFIGYYRPRQNRAYFQRYGTDEPRFFLNKNYIGGRYEVGLASLSSPLDLKIDENENSLLQIDEASNGGGMYTAVFVASSAEAFSGLKADWLDASEASNSDDQFYRIKNTKIDKIDYINSSETYILKNTPNLIYSMKAKTNGSPGTDVGVSDVDMLFSRDKSNPIIYILDKTQKFIWAYGRYNNDNREVVNEKIDITNNIKSNLAISSDGQKLLLATDTQIIACDISYATPSLLIGATATISVPSGDKCLATKPYCSFSSSSPKGDYRLITNSKSFIPAMNGAITVASGGVYLFDGNRSFLCYNPVSNDFTEYSDVLKKTASYSPIVTYDNNIYVFGSDNGNIDDTAKPTDRIQSFNPTTGEALSSLDSGNTVTTVETDSYQASINSDYSSFKTVDHSSFAISGFDTYKGKEAFDNTYYPWITSYNNTTGWVRYTNDIFPFIANSITIYNPHKDYKDYGTKKFHLVGVNSSGTESGEIASGTIPKNGSLTVDFSNNTAYKGYKIYCDSSYHSKHVGLGEIYLVRKNVQRLTPKRNKWTVVWNADGSATYYSSIKYGTTNTDVDITMTSSFWGANNLFDPEINWQSFGSNYVKFSFSQPVKADILRYGDGTSDKYTLFASKFSLYGRHDESNCVPTDSNLNGWDLIKQFTKSSCSQDVLAYELDNTESYEHYIFRINEVKYFDWTWSLQSSSGGDFPIKQLELWAELSGSPTNSNESPSDNYLTALVDDDLKSIKVGATACCSTPYGLVMAGGHVDGTGDDYATNTSLLYWPHAINKYDGTYYEFGIPRSLPHLKQARYNHVLVWHKGKVYALGGAKKDNYETLPGAGFAEYLDYNHMGVEWKTIPIASYTNLAPGEEVEWIKRFYHGACSFGDEIFVFGGRTKENTNVTTCFAWNPETGYVRRIEPLPSGINSPICAVACGSKIYVVGSNSGKLVMYEYTP